MHKRLWVIWTAAAGLCAGNAMAQTSPTPGRPEPDSLVPSVFLALVDEPPNVYPEIMPQRNDEGMNAGGANFALDIDFLTDYVYRGVVQATQGQNTENALQFNAKAIFDLGKFPHPFIGLFVNVFNDDPISRFEEVRPYFGLEWPLKPITLDVGFTSYIHPNRKNLDTQEVYSSITLDDSRIFRTVKPLFSPYIYGAYDFDLYNGFYLEAGLKHDFVFEDIGFTLTPTGDVGYALENKYFARAVNGRNYGLQHYDVGMIGAFSLNHMFNVNRRFGEFSIKGYMYYTSGIDRHLKGDTLLWGGMGLEFRY
jgi:hypothetical protein